MTVTQAQGQQPELGTINAHTADTPNGPGLIHKLGLPFGLKWLWAKGGVLARDRYGTHISSEM